MSNDVPICTSMVSAQVVISWFFLGGYGTESHSHLLGHPHAHRPAAIEETVEEAA